MRQLVPAMAALVSSATIAAAQCGNFVSELGNRVTGPVRSVAPWASQQGDREMLVIGGVFFAGPSFPCDNVGYWDPTNGGGWRAFGWGTDGPVNVVTTWDPDGSGPIGDQVIAAGLFTFVGADSTGAIVANNIARWDGSAWRPMASGLNGEVKALAVWDPDGSGPQSAMLIAGGSFTHAAGLEVDYIAGWDGSNWRALGWGFDAAVNVLTTWDPDGGGAQPPVLIAGGAFTAVGADDTGEIVARGVAAWDGNSWASMSVPAGFNPVVSYLATYDLNESGVDVPLVFSSTPSAIQPTRAWRGTFWEPVATRTLPGIGIGSVDPHSMRVASVGSDRRIWFGGTIWSMVCDDPEGGCTFQESLPTVWWENAHGVGRGDEANDSRELKAVTGWDPDGSGPGEPLLVTAVASSSFLRTYSIGHVPTMTATPEYATARVGGDATFEVNLPLPFDVSPIGWARYGSQSPLYDGTQFTGSTITGARTATMTIHNVTARDAATVTPVHGRFGAQFVYMGVTSCGYVESNPVWLEITRCSADFNADGDTGTDADIEAFFACLAGNCCDTCSSADFNGDGDFGTDADIESFFRVLAGGAC